MSNPFKQLLPQISGHPPLIPAKDLQGDLNKKAIEMLTRVGVTHRALQELIGKETAINYDRYSLYRTIEQSLEHSIISAALELYSSVATQYSSIHNATV